jgi:hypothetical protein
VGNEKPNGKSQGFTHPETSRSTMTNSKRNKVGTRKIEYRKHNCYLSQKQRRDVGCCYGEMPNGIRDNESK